MSDRPSIAELLRLCRDESANHDVELADATPVLLEIAAAALELDAMSSFSNRTATDEDVTMARRELRKALAKVRP